ncbi:MAG TPA: tetratricopeptide repeat protein [Candidatus Binatia bacterium]|jgi:tetratricopeptide (TPR) repeat protein
MKKSIRRPWRTAVLIASCAALLSSCATTAGQVQAGRQDLLYGDPNNAVAHFQRAAEIDPNSLYFSVLPEGVWTYLGRAYYASGKLPEARQALERAVSSHNDDNLAKLYLGLVLTREGDRSRGLKEIENGMRGIHDWLDYVDQRFAFTHGRFWDPNKEIRAKIQSDLALNSRAADWQKLVANGEWVGRQIEEEIDRARRDESYDLWSREGRP